MPKRTPGLTKQGKIWHINKIIKGKRFCESTRTSCLEEAERYLAKRISEFWENLLYGKRPEHTFSEAATKYLLEETKKSLWRDADSLKVVIPDIGDMLLAQVHNDSLQYFIKQRQRGGIKNITINRDLAVIRRILILAARVWRDDAGLTWLNEAPIIRMLKSDARKPRLLKYEEEAGLMDELPGHLARLVLFCLNTGCRDSEMTRLRWSEEDPGLGGFVLTGDRTKNGETRFIPLNTVAKSIVDSQRGVHWEFVFTYKGEPMNRLNGKAWRNARSRAGLSDLRVHDLRHTFGYRLRSAGVVKLDRQDLLGHKSNDINDWYCQADAKRLIEAVEKLTIEKSRKSRVLAVV